MTGLPRQVTLLLATALTLIMNYLSQSLPLFGRSNQTVSDSLPNAFVPAGLTFAIWGVIFTALIAFSVYQALPAQRRPLYDRLFWPFLLANLLNSAWLMAFQSLHIGLSVIIMLALLLSLIWLYRTVQSIRAQEPSRAHSWALQFPTSIYLGWISVATIANITAFLVSIGINGPLLGITPQTWTVILLGVAMLIGTEFLRQYRDYAFVGVLLWAFLGVYLARPEVSSIATAVMAFSAVLIIRAVMTRFGRPAAGTRQTA